MTAFLACAVFGALLLVLQLVSGLGDGADGGPDGASLPDAHAPALAGLQLFGLRAIAAALAFGGLAGAAATARGLGVPLAGGAALAAAALAAVGVAALTRLMLRFESDGTVRLERAVGTTATVHVAVPPRGLGAGKVQLAVQGRLVECPAISSEAATLPTGAPVLIVDVADGGTLVVTPDVTAPRDPAARGPAATPLPSPRPEPAP
jgi:hypothetical protein